MTHNFLWPSSGSDSVMVHTHTEVMVYNVDHNGGYLKEKVAKQMQDSFLMLPDCEVHGTHSFCGSIRSILPIPALLQIQDGDVTCNSLHTANYSWNC